MASRKAQAGWRSKPRSAAMLVALLGTVGCASTKDSGTPSVHGRDSSTPASATTASHSPKDDATDSAGEDDSTPAVSQSGLSCTAQPFPKSIDLAEASGATLLGPEILGDDAPQLLVVSDSGNRGDYLLLDPDSGVVRESGRLPIDREASDDIEGVSARGDRVYVVTSSGWMRELKRSKDGFVLTHKSYPLAALDADQLVCKSPMRGNCGQNYEGLCLRSEHLGAGECAGFVAAKATGRLFCLQADDEGHLAIDRSRSIPVAPPKTLAGCSFDDEQRLWFGTNTFSLNVIGTVEDWKSPNKAKIQRIGSVGAGFPEAIAVAPGGAVYRFSDTAGRPSLLSKYICR